MKIIVLSFCFVSYGLLYAAATPDEDSRARSGSGSETSEGEILKAVIYRPNESTEFLAATVHASVGSKFNVQCTGTIYIDHERCCMLTIADDTIGQVDQRMYRKLDNISSGTPIWNNMRNILAGITTPATHAAILLANKSALYMHVKDTASRILAIWPDGVMELAAPIDRPIDDPITILLDSGLQGIVLLRNCELTTESIKATLTDSSLRDVCAMEVVNAIMQDNVDQDRAVGYFDCKKWLALFSVVPKTAIKTVQQKKSKTLWQKLLLRKSRKTM